MRPFPKNETLSPNVKGLGLSPLPKAACFNFFNRLTFLVKPSFFSFPSGASPPCEKTCCASLLAEEGGRLLFIDSILLLFQDGFFSLTISPLLSHPPAPVSVCLKSSPLPKNSLLPRTPPPLISPERFNFVFLRLPPPPPVTGFFSKRRSFSADFFFSPYTARSFFFLILPPWSASFFS